MSVPEPVQHADPVPTVKMVAGVEPLLDCLAQFLIRCQGRTRFSC